MIYLAVAAFPFRAAIPRIEMEQALIEAKNIYKDYPLKKKSLFKKSEVIKAVRGVSFSLLKDESFGYVGESGCGKSTLSRLLIMLEKPTSGEVLYQRKNMHKTTKREMKQLREKVQLVLQDPYLSLPSWMKVGDIISDPLNIHRKNMTAGEKRKKIISVMAEVGLEADAYDRYPLSFSAGQRQMINIARAIILDPEIVILDEAVSALDVSVQAHILNLFSSLKEKRGLSYLLIAHDIGVVRHMCDRVAVMYLGRIVERGSNEDIFDNPLHPYTQALAAAVPSIEGGLMQEDVEVLSGEVPSPINIPAGCSFRSRCPEAMPVCKTTDPQMVRTSSTHEVECHLFV